MKKLIVVLFLFVFSICMFSGCSEEAESSQNETKYITEGQQQKGTEFTASQKTLDSVSNPNEDKNWSEQDITSMFSRAQEADWEYIDCVLIPDHASDRIGAVLFWNNMNKTSNVAFFDANGYYQQCGTYGKMPAEPDFTYLGDGAVTFKLEAENGTIYNYTLTISIDGNNVNFIAEDDLPK